MNWLNRWHQL
jgi:hypothetical protein